LKNKYLLFKAFLSANNIDVLFGCETFLDDSISDSMISADHKIFKKNRSSHGGGVIIGVRNNIKSLLITEFESIIIEVFSKETKILIISIYITPRLTTCPVLR
jgi:hypothetical protein